MKLAVIPGDGIGVEVTEQALRVLTRCCPASSRRSTTWARPDGTGPARCSRTGARGDPRPRRDPARRGRRPVGPLGDAGARPAAPAALRTRPLREPSPGEALPGHDDATRRPAGDRLRRVPGGDRGSLRRQRRRDSQGHPAGTRDRGQHQHRLRRRARRAGRVRSRAFPPAQAPDLGAQEQCARLCR